MDSDPALKDFRRSIDLFERLAAEFPNLPQYRNELADTYYKMVTDRDRTFCLCLRPNRP